jgi:hypothetical protein
MPFDRLNAPLDRLRAQLPMPFDRLGAPLDRLRAQLPMPFDRLGAPLDRLRAQLPMPFDKFKKRESHVEPELDDVPVRHGVILAL